MATVSPAARMQTWLAAFAAALDSRDGDALIALFAEDCYWRDLVAFTWNIKTLEAHRHQGRGHAGQRQPGRLARGRRGHRE
jgi:ketosteroid isomerase-like protein